MWRKIYDVTMSVCLAACERLNFNCTEEASAGESSYADELAPMVADLVARGIAEESEGALVVRLEDPKWGGIKEPCLVRKTDGGFLYATTDICAVRRRVQKMHADRLQSTPSTPARPCTCVSSSAPAARPGTRPTRLQAKKPCSSMPPSARCSARTAGPSKPAAARA